MHKHTVDPTPNPQQPDARTAFFAKNYNKSAQRADCDLRGIFRTPGRIRRASRGPRRALRLVTLLASNS
jgi:hypothetical protein